MGAMLLLYDLQGDSVLFVWKFLYNRGICIYHIRINESILHDRPIPFVIEGEIGTEIAKERVVGAKRTKSD